MRVYVRVCFRGNGRINPWPNQSSSLTCGFEVHVDGEHAGVFVSLWDLEVRGQLVSLGTYLHLPASMSCRSCCIFGDEAMSLTTRLEESYLSQAMKLEARHVSRSNLLWTNRFVSVISSSMRVGYQARTCVNAPGE